jgi:endonuclease-3
MPEYLDSPRRKALRIHEMLVAYYGQPHLKEQRDPLSELILTILSQNTADVNTSRAYASLRERFPTWEDVLAARDEEVAQAIRIGGLAHIKAPRIRRILAHLQVERGCLNLGFLAQMSVPEARSYLLALEGVGPKTAACVLLFSLHLPALPVDTHVHRVTRRIGLVPARATAERTQDMLEALLPPDLYYPFHLNVIRHGRTLCGASRPRCDVCPLAQDCDYAAAQAAAANGKGDGRAAPAGFS